MQIKDTILKKINTVRNRVAIAAELGVSEQSVIKLIERNTYNGSLTKLNYLQAIAKIVNVKDINSLVEK